MNSKVLFQDLTKGITIDESQDEIESTAYLLLEHYLSISRTDILVEKEIYITPSAENKIRDAIRRINTHEPVQYVLGETEFYGRKFIVNSSVLIPRPETEELVRLVVDHVKNQSEKNVRILDIGTGSGCIPVTLALEVPGAEVFATDISSDALLVANENAQRQKVNVKFFQNDILRHDPPGRDLQVVVSNPPYIAFEEKELMKDNVTLFEPHQALFVSNDNPLVFYEIIAKKAYQILQSNGLLAVEINESRGIEVMELFIKSGYQKVELIKDLSGKNRIVKGIRI